MSTSNHSCQSDRSSTESPVQADDNGSSTGDSTESDSSEDLSSHSLESEAWLLMAYAKHRMMVSLSKDVYSIFNSQWNADFKSRAGSQTASTSTSSPLSSSRTPSSTVRGKRKMQDRDSDLPDENDEEKRRTDAGTARDSGKGRFFACCFHKQNAQKYCSNSDTGTKFRSCAGPGFSRISQLK